MVVKRKLLLPLLLILNIALFGQHQIRLMSYNLENYPNGHDTDFKKIVAQINPDALVVVEMMSQNGVNQFLSNSLSTEYSAATVTILSYDSGGNANDCGFFYKSNILTLIEYRAIPAMTRVISEFKLVHNITKDTLIIFGVHLKAYPESENQTKRLSTVNTLRTITLQLKPTENYLIAGDFNIFTSTEPAFQKLTDNTSSGYFIDMLNVNGSWNNDIQFSSLCTWSTRGGIRTRLDMILISKTVNEKGGVDYVPGSFKIFGNDNKHFYSDVNSDTNYWFLTDPSVGTSLKNASDHLPVYADFLFGVPNNVSQSENIPTTFELKQNYPNPFNQTTVISYQIPIQSRVSLKIFDVLGNEIVELVNKDQSVGNYAVNFDASKISSGIYFYKLQAGNFTSTKKMILMK